MIQPDQLTELRQLRAREIQLAQSIRDGEARKQRLERELSSRQDELKRCNDLQATIQTRLNGFPSNLGDPLPETPPAPPVQKKGRK
jgi:chromosome segregation ATPase